MGRTYSCLSYHFVFSTKYRRKHIMPTFQEDLYEYMGGIIRNKSGVLLEIGGVEDHVHMLVGMPPTICISEMLQAIKANSSGWINDQQSSNSKFAWQPGYGAFTVSHSNKQQVTNYIQNQREHHQKRSFKDEFLAILVAHNVKYDPRFVFEDEHHG